MRLQACLADTNTLPIPCVIGTTRFFVSCHWCGLCKPGAGPGHYGIGPGSFPAWVKPADDSSGVVIPAACARGCWRSGSTCRSPAYTTAAGGC
jgi:hypothetical protein